MPQKNNSSKKDCREYKENTIVKFIPEYQSNHKWQGRVTREEQITPRREKGEEIINHHLMVWEGSYVGQSDENRPNDEDTSYALQSEWDTLGITERQDEGDNPENKRSPNKHHIYIEDWDIAQYNIRHRIAGPLEGINAGEIVGK